MNICFITNNIYSLGGVQRVLSVLANELSRYNTVDIICLKDESEEKADTYKLNENINVYMKPEFCKKAFLNKVILKMLKDLNQRTGIFNNKQKSDILTNIYFPEKMRKKVTEFINKKNYDVVVGVEGLNSLLLGSIKHSISAKTIGWQHNSYDAYLNNPNKYYWNLDILFEEHIPKLDKYVVLTNYDKEKFLNEKSINCDVIFNPRSFTSEEKSKCDSKVFLAAGRFTEQKGFDLLLESYKIFAEQNDEWNLVIVGEGEQKDKLIKYIEENNLNERVTIHDFTDNIKEYFLNSSTLLLSSRWEGMPMIVLESMEMGVPIISFDISASIQLIENMKQGIIVEKFNVNKFAEAMLKLSNCDELRKQLSINSIEKSKEFDIENIISKWNSILK